MWKKNLVFFNLFNLSGLINIHIRNQRTSFPDFKIFSLVNLQTHYLHHYLNIFKSILNLP